MWHMRLCIIFFIIVRIITQNLILKDSLSHDAIEYKLKKAKIILSNNDLKVLFNFFPKKTVHFSEDNVQTMGTLVE